MRCRRGDRPSAAKPQPWNEQIFHHEVVHELTVAYKNEKGDLPAESSFPHAFGGNPGGIRMDPDESIRGDGFELIVKGDAKSAKFCWPHSAHPRNSAELRMCYSLLWQDSGLVSGAKGKSNSALFDQRRFRRRNRFIRF